MNIYIFLTQSNIVFEGQQIIQRLFFCRETVVFKHCSGKTSTMLISEVHIL